MSNQSKDNNIGPKIPDIPDNNIGPKVAVVSPSGPINISKARGSSFVVKITIGNDNMAALNWKASANVSWVKINPASGADLAHNQRVTIEATVNVGVLAVGTHPFVLQTSLLSHTPGVPESVTQTPITVNVQP